MQNIDRKVRSKKLSTRVDLTAMVSVSFLLIIFFMVTIELAKPKSISLDFPNHDCCDCYPRYEGENRSITVMLGENNKLIYYMGILESPIIAPKEIKYGKDGIRKELLKRKNVLLQYASKGVKPGSMIVIIKPSKNSNYGNLVEILDEMKITGIKSYSILDDFTPEETKLLALK
ncbi:ExbD/TolR family protein [Flavobacterium pectinovorum]|uniref:Biopolymer transporter ExbD n=1 Tax=Flavobacterium pectinovorum TaxID=29533 RepID=A0A502EN13_9FLAO|nr:biopolymer transporter ExbD [Flavobacterium pectinovorum]TPG37651.1 biopolymer transporter ExbD [Flavobacterium pectinovorum]